MRIGRCWIAVFCAFVATSVYAESLEVSPARVLNDEQVSIRATGLSPQAHVVLKSSLVDGGGHVWSAEAEFVADDDGVVDTAKQAPVKGSYRIASAMGLVWSMRPRDGKVEVYEPPHNLDPQFVSFDLVTGGKKVASARLEQLQILDGVKQVQLTGKMHGIEFLPAGDGPRPGILVLGGSEGGTPIEKAAWLASHGYVALALPYFRSPGLPAKLENIPLEYFGEAISWMLMQPDIIHDEVGVVGTYRGAELALQLGSMYSQIRTIVAYAPANVRYPACCLLTKVAPAWTWRGRGLAFEMRRRNSVPSNPHAEIEVEKANGPILMIAGDDDYVWRSKEMVSEAVSRLGRHHFNFPVEHYSYVNAGNRVGLATIIPTWTTGDVQYGGTSEGNALSSVDAGPKVLEFLKKSLPQR